MKIWVDDTRSKPDKYDIRVESCQEALDIIFNADNIELISLDHDLGNGEDAHKIAKEVEHEAYWGNIEPFEWEIHSANPVGAKRIKQALENADRYWPRMSHPLNDLKWLDEIGELALFHNDEFLEALDKLSTDMQEVELGPDVRDALFDNMVE